MDVEAADFQIPEVASLQRLANQESVVMKGSAQ
jgi:hypothetical protein